MMNKLIVIAVVAVAVLALSPVTGYGEGKVIPVSGGNYAQMADAGPNLGAGASNNVALQAAAEGSGYPIPESEDMPDDAFGQGPIYPETYTKSDISYEQNGFKSTYEEVTVNVWAEQWSFNSVEAASYSERIGQTLTGGTSYISQSTTNSWIDGQWVKTGSHTSDYNTIYNQATNEKGQLLSDQYIEIYSWKDEFTINGQLQSYEYNYTHSTDFVYDDKGNCTDESDVTYEIDKDGKVYYYDGSYQVNRSFNGDGAVTQETRYEAKDGNLVEVVYDRNLV